MHSYYSIDSRAAVREMIEGSIARGLKTICFTDHKDIDYPVEEGFSYQWDFDVADYFREIKALQEEYEDQIDIRIGVEIGIQPHLGAANHAYIQTAAPFDFVIASQHIIDGQDPYYRRLFQGRKDEDVYRQALQEIQLSLDDIIDFNDFDVLGHIDYVVRYGAEQEKAYSFEKYAKELEQILKKLIAHGKGIEINTAGFKYDLPFAHPHPAILKKYKEWGGEIITIGSDAHCPEHIAYGFEKVCDILKEAGFQYYTEFKERKPYFCRLP